MSLRFNHKGFTVLEAVASIFILSLVLTTAIAIVINVRNQTEATNHRILAVEVGSRMRDDIVNNNTYDDMLVWLNGEQIIVNNENCLSLSTPFSCDIFSYTSSNQTYSDTLVIEFEAPNVDSLSYQVIHFNIIIEYYPKRFLTIEGILYE